MQNDNQNGKCIQLPICAAKTKLIENHTNQNNIKIRSGYRISKRGCLGKYLSSTKILRI